MLLRVSIWLIPLVASVAAAVGVATLLPGAVTIGGQIAWWATVLGTSALVLAVADVVLRRTLPLAALLDVSLAFPHRPPSRFAVLRQVRSVEELRERVREGEEGSAQAAADLLALVIALDEHDRATRGHSERVRLYAELLGEELDLDGASLDRLRWAALLHDIGKLTVPAEILNKGEGLEDHEWDRVQRHPAEGGRLVGPLRDWLGPWTGAIEHHHEHVDGTGYPHGLEGDRIALGGRIVAVADAFETMTAARPYKQPLTVAAARQELVAAAGTHFDPGIVRAFLNLSVPKLRHVAGWAAWVATMPGLAFLRRVPRTTGNGVVAAASIGVLAVTGSVAPTPLPTPGSDASVAQGAPSAEGSDGDTDATSGPASSEGDAGTASQADPADDPTPEARRTSPTDRDAPPRDGPDTDGADPGGSDPEDDATRDDAPPAAAGPSDDDSPSQDDDGPAGSEEPREPEDPQQVGHEDATVLRTLYLHAAPVDTTLRHDVLPLDGRAPDRDTLTNYDRDVDDDPGLRLRPSDRGRAEDRSTHRQRWAVELGEPTTLAGRLSLTAWAAIPDGRASTVTLEAYVDHCATDLTDCRPISDGAGTAEVHPGAWQQVTVDLPLGSALMLDDRVLVLTLVATGPSVHDVLVAFDTTRYPSVLETAVGVIASPQLPAGAAGVGRSVDGGPSELP